MDEPPPPREVRGNGLVLREWADTDLDALVALLDDPVVAHRTPLPSPFDRAAARRYLDDARKAERSGERVQLAITTDGLEAKGEIRLNRLPGRTRPPDRHARHRPSSRQRGPVENDRPSTARGRQR
ncbi:GNAT family N-acetyltransferase [Actinomadura nitritigenes]|uniref:GNAT family N-acetyltransferase n=1 Tax=Actinomadura nitritigenes TaxID=134602 RepID=UPI003D8EBE64